MTLPEWPPPTRHIITGWSKEDRDSYDEWRCGPVLLIDGEWNWCNSGYGWLGHINGREDTDFLCCPYCGVEV